jgi:hypothetical protein
MFGTSTIKTPRESFPSCSNRYLGRRTDDQSYNHEFSKAEIAFVMTRKHIVQGNVIKDVLQLFIERFPQHDWKAYVDKLLAIEAAIENHKHDPPYVFLGWFLFIMAN